MKTASRVLMLRHFIIYSCLAFFGFCNSRKESSGTDIDTVQILKLAMDSAVGPDSIYRNELRLPPMFWEGPANKLDSLEHLSRLQWKDSLTAILDTATLYVFIVPQYDTPSAGELENIITNSDMGAIAAQMNLKEDAFKNLVTSLATVKKTNDSVPVNKLTTNFNFIIKRNDTLPKHKLTHLGTVSFSRVAYNEAKDKACIYTSFSCGSKCGHGDILFFEKVAGHWICRSQWRTWVA
jgi:hypothetical protein